MALNDGRVVSNFIIQALKDDPITVYGSGSQSRSFCYVDDIVQGMEKMMTQDGFVGPVNLGNPVEFSILELAEKVIALTNSNSTIINEPLPQDDPDRRKPDISLAERQLGWKPLTTLEAGLTKTIAYFRNRLEQEAGKTHV